MVSGHRSLLRGAQAARPGDQRTRPVILELDAEDFLPRLLAELGQPGGLQAALARRADAREDGVLRLHQPVHRVLHVVLVEALCDAPGEPPLARERIASGGMVLRRIDGGAPRRWARRDGLAPGWLPHPAAERDDDDGYEPDPKQRARRPLGANQRVLAAAGALAEDALAEHTTPLFPAPPAVCRALGRTLLYGVVSTASAEISAPADQPPFDDDFIAGGIPGWLRADPKTPPSLLGLEIASEGVDAAPQAIPFRDELAWLVQGTGLGDEGAEATALRAVLDGLPLRYDDDGDGDYERSVGMGAFIADASAVLLERRPGATVEFPDAWPELSADQDRAVRAAVVACFTARWRQMAPATGRFEDEDARYVLRCFVRVRDECGCALRTRWSPDSEPFAIAPWYDGPARPPIRIALPDLGSLRKLKPNVAFVVPPALRKMLDGIDLKGLTDGKKPDGKWEFGMICSFSIPLITLCAFIVLSIFISLLNIVFWWMLWVKICIPFPKKK